jgi:hypothetical protein
MLFCEPCEKIIVIARFENTVPDERSYAEYSSLAAKYDCQYQWENPI